MYSTSKTYDVYAIGNLEKGIRMSKKMALQRHVKKSMISTSVEPQEDDLLIIIYGASRGDPTKQTIAL